MSQNPPATAPVPAAPALAAGPDFTNLTPAAKSVLRPNPPAVFDGDRTQGQMFLHSVLTYLRLVPEAFMVHCYIPYHHGLIRTSSDHLRHLPVNSWSTPGQLPVNSRSTLVYLGLIPGRHPDYNRMTSGYHLFISVLFRLNVPVFSGTFRPLSDFIRPFSR
ncbi:hypothetical protein K438DRAFT_1996122 [Mycena galopus ATCC 62051]|nr:hypothetical protein K438DRAFT_1996122 [Mycena galopus ATCC 62051]